MASNYNYIGNGHYSAGSNSGSGSGAGDVENGRSTNKTPQQIAAQFHMKQTQIEVDDVVEKMRKNAEDLLQRDGNLGELGYRAEVLKEGAARFEDNAVAMKRKAWRKNMKNTMIISGIGIVCVLLVCWKLGFY